MAGMGHRLCRYRVWLSGLLRVIQVSDVIPEGKGAELMTPFSFEWQWNIEYFIFMGLLYLALAIIGAGLVYALIKTWMAIIGGQESKHDDHT